MTEEEYQMLKTKIEAEFPIRLQLSAKLGRPINVNVLKELYAFDTTLAELEEELRKAGKQ
jgi:hypothetical protein